jgi:predicted dehydrogenase
MADLFGDRLERSRRNVKNSAEAEGLGQKFAVDDDHCFTGFDAYKKVMESDVDLVILAATPHFRPRHLAAAVDAGKHVFCEKPVAVDGPGVRQVLESAQKAKLKNLSIVSGLCWRYDLGVRETVNRVLDGAIGDMVAIHTNYLTGTLWHRGRKPEWSEMEYQLRNWLYFTWLSGDHIVEQHIHSLDKAVWLMNDELPARCFGLGGRQVRTEEKWGNIYDHHAVCYEFANGLKVFAYTRQMGNCHNDVNDYVLGTHGKAELLSMSIEGENPWKYSGPRPSMYDVEHVELFKGIRDGKPINNGIYMANSTMMAIMGRMACYTGELITGEKALYSTEDLRPESYEFGDVVIPEVPMPGRTRFS